MADDWRAPGPRDWKCEYNATGTEIHVRPRNDLMWHHDTSDCPCGPAVTHLDDLPDSDARRLAIHHALDGRARPDGGFTPDPLPTDCHHHGGEYGGVAA